MYKVITRFRDLTDGHLYEAGDRFPFDGREVSAERLDTLVNGQNRASKALIAKDEESVSQPAEQPKKAVRGRRKSI